MGWITRRLGNGLWGTVDGDIPDSPPQVSFNGTITTNPELTQNFGRILNEQFNENEVILLDKPQTYDGTFEYVGVALSNASINDPVWDVIRFTWVLNRHTKVQFQSNIAWSARTEGWPQ